MRRLFDELDLIEIGPRATGDLAAESLVWARAFRRSSWIVGRWCRYLERIVELARKRGTDSDGITEGGRRG